MSVIYVVEIAGILDSPHVKFPITLTTLSTSKKRIIGMAFRCQKFLRSAKQIKRK